MDGELPNNDFKVIYDGPSPSPGKAMASTQPLTQETKRNVKLIGLTEAREILKSISRVKSWTSREDLVTRLREPDLVNYFCNDGTKGKEWSDYWRQVLSRRILFDGADALENVADGLRDNDVRSMRNVAERSYQLQEMLSNSGVQQREDRHQKQKSRSGTSQPKSYPMRHKARFGHNPNIDTTSVSHKQCCGCSRCGRSASQNSEFCTKRNDTGGRSQRSSYRTRIFYRYQNYYTLVDDANLVRAVADMIVDVQRLHGSHNLRRLLSYVRSSTWSYQELGLRSLTDRYNSLPGSNRRSGGSLKNRWQILVQNWAKDEVDEQIFNSVEARNMCLELARVYIKNCLNCRSPRNTN